MPAGESIERPLDGVALDATLHRPATEALVVRHREQVGLRQRSEQKTSLQPGRLKRRACPVRGTPTLKLTRWSVERKSANFGSHPAGNLL